jgi:hypothetical protein
LKVGGNLYLDDSAIETLPEGVKVGGHLFLRKCPNLISISEGLTVRGHMFLQQSKIESLPKDLEVGGTLTLAYSEIKSLPKGLKVGGNLEITGTRLAKLSDNEIFEMIKPNGFIKRDIIRD